MKTPKPTASLFLDARRAKSNNKYPVKIRIYYNGQTKLYKTGNDIAEKDFERSYLCQKPRVEYRDLKIKFERIVSKANETIDELKPFSFEQFEKKMFRLTSNRDNVFFHYEHYMKKLNKEGRPGTASSCEVSMKSLKTFIARRKDILPTYLSFHRVTPDFLRRYEVWMLEAGRSITTVGIYLRALRTIFNIAIEERDISVEIYPFGKNKFQIPAGRNIKKALQGSELNTLFNHPLPSNSIMEKARHFWFFSFNCNGINMKDMAQLRYKNFNGEWIAWTRSKTKNTTRTNSRPITAFATDFMKQIIEKYGNKNESPETYIFPILKESMNEADKRTAVQNFTRFINDQIKNIAKAAKLSPEISSMTARHSFATTKMRNGGRMEMIQEDLGHQSLPTTQNYWAGFADETKKEFAEKLMQF